MMADKWRGGRDVHRQVWKMFFGQFALGYGTMVDGETYKDLRVRRAGKVYEG